MLPLTSLPDGQINLDMHKEWSVKQQNMFHTKNEVLSSKICSKDFLDTMPLKNIFSEQAMG